MARKKIARGLPPLPSRPTFKAKKHKGAQLLEILRGIAIANQEEEPRVFYPIREVARHLGVPVSTVSRVYDALEEEGILVSVRGSKTLLQGLGAGRHLSVLGFIGMPALTPSFVTLQDYRTFFIRTRRELRVRGFAVATVFYDRSERQTGRIFSRIDKYDFDTVLWYEPDRAAKETAPQLKDKGVQVIGVSNRWFPSIRCRYEVQRESAIRSILRDWRANDAITSVVVVREVELSAAREELLKTFLEEEGIAYEFKSPGDQRLADFLNSLTTDKHRGIIFPSTAAALFAFRAPEAFTKLMTRARVAMSGGPSSFPFAQVPDVVADLVVVDWQLVAEQIVTDLINRIAFNRAETTTFEAKAHLRAPLIQYSQRL
jgi:IclR helix-turn-helix domain